MRIVMSDKAGRPPHRWFAWRPVRCVNGGIESYVWLEHVTREIRYLESEGVFYTYYTRII